MKAVGAELTTLSAALPALTNAISYHLLLIFISDKETSHSCIIWGFLKGQTKLQKTKLKSLRIVF